VTALNAGARIWRGCLGFEYFDPEDAGQFDLYLLTSDIEATLGLIR
jgi:hypothetical protein